MGHPYVVMDECPGKLHPLTGDERRFWGEKSQGVNAAPYSTSWVWTRKKSELKGSWGIVVKLFFLQVPILGGNDPMKTTNYLDVPLEVRING